MKDTSQERVTPGCDPGSRTAAAASRVFADGERAEAYVRILATRGVERGLIGPREVPRLWERHLLNSVAVSSLISAGVSVVDVGSGAGLPGIPLAVARPDLRITLLEPLLRRATFLHEVTAELGLDDRVTVIRGRAEDCRDRFEVVTARAVAPLARLLGWTRQLFLPDGALLALKGASAADEVRAARTELGRLGVRAQLLSVRADPDADPTTVVVVSG
mgnify:FL=1